MPVLEHRFHPERKFRFDFAWVDLKVALEIEGGIWTRGRHVRPIGYQNDLIKYNLAAYNGWFVFRHIPQWINNKKTINELIKYFQKSAL